jgi:hypothetical protein
MAARVDRVVGDVKPDAKPRCRACNSPDVRISYPRFWDYVLARSRHFEVFRCRACQHRFRAYLNVGGTT